MLPSNTSIDMKQTGMKLKQYARKKGFSVKDIQHFLGLSCPQPVYRWYKGSILPSVDNLLKLSELFEVHMEELLVKEDRKGIRITTEYDIPDSAAFYRRLWEYYERVAA